MNTNRKYKDSVFSLLFSDPDLLRELYCALNGVDLPSNVQVNINTLKNVLFDYSYQVRPPILITFGQHFL